MCTVERKAGGVKWHYNDAQEKNFPTWTSCYLTKSTKSSNITKKKALFPSDFANIELEVALEN